MNTQSLQSAAPIENVVLHTIAMPMVEVLVTSFGSDAGLDDALRGAVLLEMHLADGTVGWGECVAAWTPGYSYETIETALHVLTDFFIPAIIGKTNLDKLRAYRGHPMARMAVEAAFWSAVAAQRNVPLGALIAEIAGIPEEQRKTRVEVGVSIGIQPSIDATLGIIDKRLKEGYRRIKLKIKPGWDVEMLRAVRATYPDIVLMADANSAYTIEDLPLLKQLEDLNLLRPPGYLSPQQTATPPADADLPGREHPQRR
jgi:O-succinylbenzoate synthase